MLFCFFFFLAVPPGRMFNFEGGAGTVPPRARRFGAFCAFCVCVLCVLRFVRFAFCAFAFWCVLRFVRFAETVTVASLRFVRFAFCAFCVLCVLGLRFGALRLRFGICVLPDVLRSADPRDEQGGSEGLQAL